MKVAEGAIVVAVDGSPESEMGVHWAAVESQRCGAPLHVLHCLEEQIGEVPPTREEWLTMRANAEHLIESSRRIALDAGASPVTVDIVEVSPVAALVSASRSAAMVVLGAQGHGILYRMWLGSTSRQVSDHARCPVVVVRHDTRTAQNRIVVGVDGSPGSARALQFAFQLAQRRKAEVVAICAWPDHDPATTGSAAPAWSGTSARIEEGLRLLADVLGKCLAEYPDVPTSMEALPVRPAKALADASEHASLVVVGAHRRDPISHPGPGSVARRVLHHARCPVAVVP